MAMAMDRYFALMTIFLSILAESIQQQGATNFVDYTGIADVVQNLVSFGNSDLNIISDFKLPFVQSGFLSQLTQKGMIDKLFEVYGVWDRVLLLIWKFAW